MLDERDLQAIAKLIGDSESRMSAMMDQKLDAKLAPINTRLDKLEAAQAKMEQELKAGQAQMEQELKAGQAQMKQELKAEISHEIRAMIEVEVIPKFDLLADGHALIIEKMVDQDELEDAKEDLQVQVNVLKAVVQLHSREIEKLKKHNKIHKQTAPSLF